MDCVDCIFYGLFYCRLYERFSLFDTNVLTGFMISLFLAAPAPRVRRARKLMGTSLQHGLRSFSLVLEKVLFYTEVKFSY